MSSSKTLAAKVARRIVGFQGMAKAAQDNAARLHEKVEALRADVAKLAAVVAALATKAEQEAKTVQDQGAQINGLMLVADSLAGRVAMLEEAARPAPAAEPGTVAEPETDASIEPEYVCPPSHDDE